MWYITIHSKEVHKTDQESNGSVKGRISPLADYACWEPQCAPAPLQHRQVWDQNIMKYGLEAK